MQIVNEKKKQNISENGSIFNNANQKRINILKDGEGT